MSPYAFVITWAAQAALLGLLALILPRLLRIRQPAMLESWWVSNTLGVVLLPILPVLLPARSSAPLLTLEAMADTTVVALAAAPDVARLLSPLQWLAVVWSCGVLVRLTWLIAGQRRLRRLAESGSPIVDDPALQRARVLTASHQPRLPLRGPVPVIATDHAGPCVFGWMEVRVLVPRALASLPEEQRVSVYLHELLHAVRFDVQRSYADEVWRLIWWWQPAVWWMLGRLRLTRELQVDRAVVESTGQRRPYVEALMWCGARPRTFALSAQVGVGRHSLVRRVALLCEEVEMSRMRKWATIGVLLAVFATTSAVLGLHSPLRAAQVAGSLAAPTADSGPLERIASRPTLDMPAPRRIVAVEPVWSEEGVAYRFRVHLVIDAAGHVAESRLVSVSGIELAPDGPAPLVSAAREAAMAAVRQWQFEAPVQAPMLIATDVTVGKTAAGAESHTAASPLAVARRSSGRLPIRVAGNIAPPTKLVDVKAIYPQAAMDAQVSGVVILDVTIDGDGAVSNVDVTRSIPLLDQAAVDAVRQWKFTPTLLNGEPVPVIVTITVNFSLK
jgi:TonB family protein